jgi:ribosomal protein S18 acetylase RimI-like enzyme
MIYYKKDNLIIRSMSYADIEAFALGFASQGRNKPVDQFLKYYKEQEDKVKKIIVAEFDGSVAGYVTLLPFAPVGPFADKNFPEIVDFNVLIQYQKRGIGNCLMDIAEQLAKDISDYVTLAVGMHSGYGTAQRMYVKRGYIPDGSGVWYKDKPLEPYGLCKNDDELILYFVKKMT